MEKWKCTLCDYVYDSTVGDPDGGVELGIAFEDLPKLGVPVILCAEELVQKDVGGMK
jgi:hypothetical protein